LSGAESPSYAFDPKVAAKLLSLMSNPVRLGILERISQQEWDVNALANALNLSQSALSQHLFRLRAARLVKTRRSAQQILYSSDSIAVLSMLAALAGLGLAGRVPVQSARRPIQGRRSRTEADAV
jgi:DNA-binding transcriptional ArsR family regulator